MRSSILPALLIACNFSLLIPSGHAQQAPRAGSTSPVRRGYFVRVQTDSLAASPATEGFRSRSRLDQTRSVDGRSRNGSTLDTFRGEPDPLRAYSSGARESFAIRPYERPPVVSPPQRETPAPAVSHNYYPSLRAGQGPNRNAGSHCVPSRGALLHR